MSLSEQTISLCISDLAENYANRAFTPADVIASIHDRCAHFEEHNVWITLLSLDELEPYLNALEHCDKTTKPLWGIPFALKDNIDLAGVRTTAACEAFAYQPTESAVVVNRLIDAGAIPIGKANLDQFATGLNGTRSPWGACRNSVDKRYVSGGSSAGSAVSVALGLSSFSLGTDTAGSGRVPAGFNNLVGLKPTRGLVPTTGVVPACKSLDCVSIFALNTDDADRVLSVMEGEHDADEYSRANTFDNRTNTYGVHAGPLTVGVLSDEDLRFFGDDDYEQAYQQTVAALQSSGVTTQTIDFAPFDEVALLLYEGPWVSERYIATSPLIQQQPEALHETVRAIIEPGGKPSACDLFTAEYRLNALRKRCVKAMQGLDCLLTPTAGRLFTIDEMLSNPIRHNSDLGYYTNFVNLLDLSAVAVPTLFTRSGLPFGVTLVGKAFEDRFLLSVANRIQKQFPLTQGATELPLPVSASQAVTGRAYIDVVVCGAHMNGLPLNYQLSDRGAVFKEAVNTAPRYALYQLPGDTPMRPALVEQPGSGHSIMAEVWSVPAEALGSFLHDIPAPLGLGKVTLSDERVLTGFICADGGVTGATDISSFGGWRAFLQSQQSAR